MRILCTETEGGLADGAVATLKAAGHEVCRCFAPDSDPTALCVGLEEGTCPLDRLGGVDVVLAVRSPGHPRAGARETGVTCALRRGVPLALAGAARLNPYARWVAATAEGSEGPAEACRQAAERRLVDLGDAVSASACKTLGRDRRPGVDVHTDVRSFGRELQVTVHRPAADARLDGVVAVHAHAALRAAGVEAAAISLSCTE
jgi:hypothetical protein